MYLWVSKKAEVLIPRNTVSEILDAARIEEVIGDFVALKRRGSNLLGLCPFHNEKTPSFTVSTTKGIYKCFGCGKAGNAVNFIMEHEKSSYPEALRYLANKYNIPVEETEPDPAELQAETEREALFGINLFAQKYFTRQLHETEEGIAIGRSYFLERGFREDTIRKFQLGYSPRSWDDFATTALEQGYKKELLVKAGLVIEKDPRIYDRFRERVIFPVHNLSGKVIAFGGRLLTNDKTKPKYVNSPETEIYNKSKSLYGIYFARNAIGKLDNCYLVEGYTDVISLYQAGIENVVASSGTSLTTEQIKLIGKFTRNITILFDGDIAGIKASFRGIDMILEQGLNVQVVLFPEGQDPDSYASTHTASDVEGFLATSAVDFINFKTRLLVDETRNDPIKKARLIHEILGTISLIPDTITRSLYIKECAVLMDVDERTLMLELNKQVRRKIAKQYDGPAEDVPEGFVPELPEKQPVLNYRDASAQERDVIRVLLNYGHMDIQIPLGGTDEPETTNVARFICNDISANQIVFDDRHFQLIFDEFHNALETNSLPDEKVFLHHEDPQVVETAVDLLSVKYELSSGWSDLQISVPLETDKLTETVTHSMLSLMHKKLEIKLKDLQSEMNNDEMGEEEKLDLLSKNVYIKKILREINRQLGRTIVN